MTPPPTDIIYAHVHRPSSSSSVFSVELQSNEKQKPTTRRKHHDTISLVIRVFVRTTLSLHLLLTADTVAFTFMQALPLHLSSSGSGNGSGSPSLPLLLLRALGLGLLALLILSGIVALVCLLIREEIFPPNTGMNLATDTT